MYLLHSFHHQDYTEGIYSIYTKSRFQEWLRLIATNCDKILHEDVGSCGTLPCKPLAPSDKRAQMAAKTKAFSGLLFCHQNNTWFHPLPSGQNLNTNWQQDASDAHFSAHFRCARSRALVFVGLHSRETCENLPSKALPNNFFTNVFVKVCIKLY